MLQNDNAPAGRGPPPYSRDAHGRAALLLVESLIHVLIERSVLTVEEATEIIATSMEVQADIAEAADGSAGEMWRSHAIISSIKTSLDHDLNRRDGSER